MGRILFNGGFHLASMLVALSVGVVAGRETVPYATELTTARSLSRANVELIGFDCADHKAVIVAEFEDEFPEAGCREIRRLDNERPFL